MGTIYQFNQLTKLEFEIDSIDVLMCCEIMQFNLKNQFYFKITHSELNLILGSIQTSNSEIELSEFLIYTELNSDDTLVSLNLNDLKIETDCLNTYDFHQQYKEIRA